MFNKHLWNKYIVYYTSGAVLGMEYSVLNEKDNVPDLMVLTSKVEKTNNNNHNEKIIAANDNVIGRWVRSIALSLCF